MTIIAASHREMAADQLITAPGAPPIYSHKIGIVAGSIWGYAGDSAAGARFLDWRRRVYEARPGKAQREEEKDAPIYGDDEEFECLELRKDGTLHYWTNSHACLEILNAFYAVGSGDSLAIHHMNTGKTPKRSCELVLRAQKWAVGTIDVLTLDDIKVS